MRLAMYVSSTSIPVKRSVCTEQVKIRSMFMRLAIYVSMYIYTYENIHAENADVKSEILQLTSELATHVKVQMIETDLPVASRFGATLGLGASSIRACLAFYPTTAARSTAAETASS